MATSRSQQAQIQLRRALQRRMRRGCSATYNRLNKFDRSGQTARRAASPRSTSSGALRAPPNARALRSREHRMVRPRAKELANLKEALANFEHQLDALEARVGYQSRAPQVHCLRSRGRRPAETAAVALPRRRGRFLRTALPPAQRELYLGCN